MTNEIDPIAVRKLQLENNLDTIVSAYRVVSEQLSVIESTLSRLPNRVAGVLITQIPANNDSAIEWHERLRMLEKMVSNGKQSWIHTEHDLANIIVHCRREVLGES